jgi:uncharacterized RDD family membrane protein YckC
MTEHVAPDRDLNLQGRYAGIVTRFTAFCFDLIGVLFVYAIFVAAVNLLVSTLSGRNFKWSSLTVAPWLTLVVWALFYCSYPVAAGGRTLGMAIVGLRVLRSDGRPVSGWQAVVRVVALPLCFLTLGVGFLLIVLRRDRRALNDLVGGTAVVYAWDARAARLRFLARQSDEPPAGTLQEAPPSGPVRS